MLKYNQFIPPPAAESATIMEFNEKLQKLRKQRGLTQEELAETLFVSRTAVSKWESGRGYPNIDSLKAIAKLFSVTIDELLSSEEVLTIAEENGKEATERLRNLVFGLLDCSVTLFLFLPFFAQRTQNMLQEVSLFALTEISLWLKTAYWAATAAIILWGILTLAMQNRGCSFRLWRKGAVSLILNAAAALLFIVSLQPYAAALLFVFLIIKVFMLVK